MLTTRISLAFLLLFSFSALKAQSTSKKLEKAYQAFESDEQLKHAISSLYVIDANTGEVVFDKNSQVGLAPASTQKIITSVTAFELLGKDFRYKTSVGYRGQIVKDTLKGDLVFLSYGDPTLGSWRYTSTTRENVLEELSSPLEKQKIKLISGSIIYNHTDFSQKLIPDGWIWQDLGNYYGAPAYSFNWGENQNDLILQSGSEIGDTVKVPGNSRFVSEVKSAAKGSGDNAYAYLPTANMDHRPFVAGTIPVNENTFKISITDEYPLQTFKVEFAQLLYKKGITGKNLFGANLYYLNNNPVRTADVTVLGTYLSPTLDSIIYWFNKKSINLYGEALVKTFAYEKQGLGSTDSGVVVLKNFWKEKGFDEDELNISDGSGLSPLNRVTTHVQVEILKYAKTKDWFPDFYNALPEYNGMKMKSGTISDVKGFCGYHTSKDEREYIFSFLVNNYSGKTSGVVGKMYKVLDELK